MAYVRNRTVCDDFDSWENLTVEEWQRIMVPTPGEMELLKRFEREGKILDLQDKA
jgi:hypothetical protein